MNIEAKLKIFTQSALEEAAELKEKMNKEVEGELAHQCQMITEKYMKIEEERYKKELELAENQRNKEVMKASKQQQMSVLDLRNKLNDMLFEKIAGKLMDFVASDEYGAYLIKAIKKEMDKGENGVVELYSQDMGLAESVTQATGLPVVESKNQGIGGFKIVFDNCIVDNLFDTKLAEEKEKHIMYELNK